jgi:hypothetical protein
MALLPTMSQLAALRRDGIGDVAIELQRQHFRQKWESLVNSPLVSALSGENEWAIFSGMWTLFHLLPPTHALYLHPLFPTPELESLLRGLALKCLTLDRAVCGIGGGTSGSGHKALAGTLGVGKTYIMRGFALVAAAICVHCVPIPFDFEGHGAGVNYDVDSSAARASLPPISLILQAASAVYVDGIADAGTRIRAQSTELETDAIGVGDSSMTAVATMLAHKIIPLLILDEVNLCCFTNDSNDVRRVRGRYITAQLQRFGRQRNTFALISGSSLSFREQLFAKGKWSQSTSLNGTLFYVSDVTPLRDIMLLQAYTKSMFPAYGDVSGTGMEPWQRLLSLSGGVGRAIETVVGGDTPKPRYGYPPTELIKDPFLRVVLTEMLDDSDNALQLEAKWPLCVRVPEARIKSALDKLGCISVDDKLLKWRDDGVLYLNGDNLELLYPYLVKELAPLLHDNYRSIIIVQYQLTGIRGSIGAVAESLFRPGVHRIMPVDCQPPLSFKSGVLKSKQFTLLYESPTTRDGAPFKAAEHFGELVSWKAQVGVEDFVLHADVAMGDEDHEEATSCVAGSGSSVVDLLLSAWQGKVPKLGTITTWRDYDATVASVVKERAVSHLDPIRYLDHAIVKAQWGMALLAAKLQESERVRVHPHVLFVTTTAVLDSACKSKIVGSFSWSAALLQAACDIHVKRGSMTAADVRAASDAIYLSVRHMESAKLCVRFVDGVEWTDEVAGELCGMFNTPKNRAVVAQARAGSEAGTGSMTGTHAAASAGSGSA